MICITPKHLSLLAIVCNYLFCHELSVFATRMKLHEDRDCVLFAVAPSAPKRPGT